MSTAPASVRSAALTNPAAIEVLVNARHLTGPKTGIEVYMEQLLAALSQTGQVRITAISWGPLGLELPGLREVIPMQRPNVVGLAATLWKLWFDQWYSFRAVAGYDGVLLHGMDGFLPYSLRSRDRAVTTVHDLGWHVHPELFDRRVRLMYNALFPWVRRRTDRFIAVSRYTADDLMRSAGVPASKIDVVYHGLDPIFSRSPIQKTDATSAPYLLAMGGISPARKNTRRLLAAFSRWRARGGHRSNYRLLLTGVSLDRYFRRSGERLPEGVSLAGYVETAKLPELYAGAAAFLYPGIYEGFGLPIIEAMACGTPVLTSSTGAAPEIAGGAAILVDPFDVDSIVEGIERVTMKEEADRLRALGGERILPFNWGTAAEMTVEVYRRLAP